MNKNYIYISVGWLSFALCCCAVSSCITLSKKYHAEETKEAMKNGYEEVVEKHSGTQYVLWKKPKGDEKK